MVKFWTLGVLMLINLIFNSNVSIALKCYSCSTRAGDSFCTEDNFDPFHLSVVECQKEADVCVRAIQISNGDQSDDNLKQAGAVFRSCGSSLKSEKPEILNLGYYPLLNDCIIHKIGNESEFFKNSVFKICACASDLGNGKGEMNCRTQQDDLLKELKLKRNL